MHQSFDNYDCGNFRSKLQKLRLRLDAIDLLIHYSSQHFTTPAGQRYVVDAKKALEEIRQEL